MKELIPKKKQPKAVSKLISDAMIANGFVMDVEIVKDWLWRFYGFRINVCQSLDHHPKYTGIVFINQKLGRCNYVNGKEVEFSSKEEAIEDAVRFALTLIK